MSQSPLSYRIFQSGDNAVVADYGNVIDPAVNREVIARFHSFRKFPVPGIIEVVPAYCSLLFYYDVPAIKRAFPGKATAAEVIREEIGKRLAIPLEQTDTIARQMRIPVCYDPQYAPDMQRMIDETGLTDQEIIQLHTSITYQVYMLGFLPGFAYMGEVNSSIAVARKPQPVAVEAGSVGIAGMQTGIYSFNSPGGWNIIGKTPLRLFDPTKAKPALLEAGDSVTFYPITANEFADY